jgi:hypothetical protein
MLPAQQSGGSVAVAAAAQVGSQVLLLTVCSTDCCGALAYTVLDMLIVKKHADDSSNLARAFV